MKTTDICTMCGEYKGQLCHCKKQASPKVEQPAKAKPEHTPTPWHLDNEGKTVVGADGIQICTPHGLRNPQPSVNAAFIVRAVTCYEDLLKALREAREALCSAANLIDEDQCATDKLLALAEVIQEAIDKAEQI